MPANTDISGFEDIPESYQEYLETIYRIYLKKKGEGGRGIVNMDIANFLGFKPPSVTNMLKKLRDKGLVEWKPRSKNITLTEKGKKIARRLLYNHLIFEAFFYGVLKIRDPALIHKLACEFEHHLVEPLLNAYRTVLGKPNVMIIEKWLDEEKDPEMILDNINPLFMNLTSTVNALRLFTEKLSEEIPEYSEKITEIEKDFEFFLNTGQFPKRNGDVSDGP